MYTNRIQKTLQHLSHQPQSPTISPQSTDNLSVENFQYKPSSSNSKNARKELLADLSRIKPIEGEDDTDIPIKGLYPEELYEFLKLYVQRIGVEWSDNFGKYMCEKVYGHFDRNYNRYLEPDEVVAMIDEFVYAPRAKSRHNVTVCVFGGGAFGTAMAHILANKGNLVKILMRPDEIEHVNSINERKINTMCFKETRLPANISATIDPEFGLANASWIVHAVPVQFSAGFLSSIKHLISPNVPIICVSKGICLKTLKFMHEIIPEVLGRNHPSCFLCGPSFAEGILKGDPTSVVVASTLPELSRSAQCLFSTARFRVYTSLDVKGLEIGSALKNVLAIAAGIADGLGYGANSSTFLVTRGWAEIRKICVLKGAEERTLAGLSGIGDLMLTCFGGKSRNAQFGKKLVELNGNIYEALKQAGGVVEGFPTARAARDLGEKNSLELPIITAIADTLDGKITPKEMMNYIMTFTLGPED